MYKSNSKNLFVLVLFLVIISSCAGLTAADRITKCYSDNDRPYASNNGFLPRKNEWFGLLYESNHNYPLQKKSKKKYPWQQSINNKKLTQKNVKVYLESLKKYLEKNGVKTLVNNKDKFDAVKHQWYSMPWRGQYINKYSGQEAISGTYDGQLIPANTFKGVDYDAENHTLVYFNYNGAYTLGQVFKNVCEPSISNNQTQYEEGTIIIKFAVVTISPKHLTALKKTSEWHVYRPVIGTTTPQIVKKTYLMQMDIVIKDSQSSPITGWVFAAYLYDSKSPGKTVYDRLHPLGAAWGNSPTKTRIESWDYGKPYKQFAKTHPDAIADEEWINPYWLNADSPSYATQQLGWGYRLAGPVDRARVTSGYEVPLGLHRGSIKRARISSCMSCHGASLLVVNKSNAFVPPSNLYPSPHWRSDPTPIYKIGGSNWNKWFENRSGKIPLGGKRNGVVSTDFSPLLMMAIDLQRAAKSNSDIKALKLFSY